MMVPEGTPYSVNLQGKAQRDCRGVQGNTRVAELLKIWTELLQERPEFESAPLTYSFQQFW